MKRMAIAIFSIILTILAGEIRAEQPFRYAGGDISLLPEYENAGAKYKTHSGTQISNLLSWLRQEGMNAMRVRVFVDPDSYKGSDKDPNACQDLQYIIPLCQKIKNAGMALMIDFHYSDTWTDPGKQWTPAAWSGLNASQLCDKIYEYTKETLITLKEAGATPDFIQTGNEISYGMMWGPYGTPDSQLLKTYIGNNANWQRLGNLLKSAGKACREVCPDAKIVIHTERTGNIQVQDNFYTQMNNLDVDYDIIGLSYYPYFHGTMSQLNKALTSLETKFPDKRIMIVETGYSYAWEVPGTSSTTDYPYSDAGQNEFAQQLVSTLRSHDNVDGLFWWWMEYNAFGTSLSGWYNAPLFDSRTGCATSALHTIASFAEGNTSVVSSPSRPSLTDEWYDISGFRIAKPSEAGLYIKNKQLVFKRR